MAEEAAAAVGKLLLINAKNRDISVYPQGDFAALNAYLDRLNAEK